MCYGSKCAVFGATVVALGCPVVSGGDAPDDLGTLKDGIARAYGKVTTLEYQYECDGTQKFATAEMGEVKWLWWGAVAYKRGVGVKLSMTTDVEGQPRRLVEFSWRKDRNENYLRSDERRDGRGVVTPASGAAIDAYICQLPLLPLYWHFIEVGDFSTRDLSVKAFLDSTSATLTIGPRGVEPPSSSLFELSVKDGFGVMKWELTRAGRLATRTIDTTFHEFPFPGGTLPLLAASTQESFEAMVEPDDPKTHYKGGKEIKKLGYGSSIKLMDAPVRTDRFRLLPRTVKINAPLADEATHVAFPKGTPVTDVRKEAEKASKIVGQPTHDAKDYKAFEKALVHTVKEAQAQVAPVRLQADDGWTTSYWIGGFGALILLAGGFLVLRREA